MSTSDQTDVTTNEMRTSGLGQPRIPRGYQSIQFDQTVFLHYRRGIPLFCPKRSSYQVPILTAKCHNLFLNTKKIHAHPMRGPGKLFNSSNSDISGSTLLADSMYTRARCPWVGSLGNTCISSPPVPKLTRMCGTLCLVGVRLHSSVVQVKNMMSNFAHNATTSLLVHRPHTLLVYVSNWPVHTT